MSRAFVKEPDEGAPVEGLPDRQISDHPNYVTPAGLMQLEDKVGELETRRLALLDDEDGLAREQLVYVDRDLRYYTARLESAIPVAMNRQPRRKVAFGAAVSVSQNGGESRTFTIVGEDEADLKVGKISYVSPLAEALIDARVGKTVLWRRPAGNIELTVEAIEYPEDPAT
jgi:transcription elongation factor GreB